MKTKVFNKFGLLAAVVILIGLISCDKEEGELPYYDEIENEKVIAELDNVPAYVYDTYRDCVFICYSEYADEYYKARNEDPERFYAFPNEIDEDIWNHQIGVKRADFDTYGIPLNSKVYVSALITNNKAVKLDPNIIDAAWGGRALENKAYLINITPRN
ncbi:MAG: hypothetical protein LBV32_00645 [Tannerellaceae bacterium]|jgi:hypothetical protein|nr:hypothetical protein [Tannerellaceae bacterium]